MTDPIALPAPATVPAPRCREIVSVSCRGCDSELPIRLALAGEDAGLWQCTGCQARYAGILQPEEGTQFLTRVRLADRHFDASSAPRLPDIARTLVNQLHQSSRNFDGVDRRQSVRIPEHLPAVVTRLDRLYVPVGRPLHAIVHNLSEDGLGFLSVEAILAPHVVIAIARGGAMTQLFSRVVRTRLLRSPIYETGVAFTFRLAEQFVVGDI